MLTPTWYYQAKKPLYRWLLWPLSLLFGLSQTLRQASASSPYRAKAKVISIGNLSVGGSGKTPVARALGQDLTMMGFRCLILSRGYGGTEIGPLMVDPKRHSASDVGDEPLMLSQTLNIMIAKDRALGLKQADSDGYDIVILDDAHQNPNIIKDLSLVLIDAQSEGGRHAFGDQRLLPMGPLREPLSIGLKRADHIVLVVPPSNPDIDHDLWLNLAGHKAPKHKISLWVKKDQSTPKRVHGFAGIAKPWRFAQSLKEQGFDMTGFTAFGDHEPISPSRLDQLRHEAKAQKSDLITTEKDFFRLSTDQREGIHVLSLEAKLPAALVDGWVAQLGLTAPISRL